MNGKKKIRFIINPISGTGKQKNILSLIQKHVSSALFDYDVVFTKYPQHATALCTEAVKEKYSIVVAVGGDGSVNEISKGLINCNTALAIIPTGSGNGLARHLKIPLQIKKAIQLIHSCKIKTIDTALVNNEIFVVTTGVGFDALVASEFAKCKKRGLKTYLKIIWKNYRKYHSQDSQITIDGNTFQHKAFIVCIANSSQYGNNASIAPQAIIDDGFLDVCVLKEFPIYVIPFLVFQLFNNAIHYSKYMKISKGQEITIESKDKELSAIMHIDGDPFHFQYPLKMKIVPQSLKVLVP